MVYKTKKINRKKYSKRQTNKLTRKMMYGGDDNDKYNILPPAVVPIEKEPEQVPTFRENLNELVNVAETAVAKGSSNVINRLATNIGVDPNKPSTYNIKQLTESAKEFINVLESPEGQELKKEASELVSESVDILKPGINKVVEIGNELLEKQIPIIGQMANEVVLATPVVGQAAAAAEEVGNLVQSAENAAKSVADVISVGAETKKNLNAPIEKAHTLIGKVTNLIGNISTNANKVGADIIGSVKEKVDAIPLKKYQQEKVDDITLKKYQKEAQMIGGRLAKSQLEFMSSPVTMSQITRQYGGKFRTKSHRSLKRRLTSRRH